MIFEEVDRFVRKFPSLIEEPLGGHSFSYKAIEKCCIDKQRVKEALGIIKSYVPTRIRNVDAGTFNMIKLLEVIKEKEKELGLEE